MSPPVADGSIPPVEGPPTHADQFLLAVAVDGEIRFTGPSVPRVLGFDREAVTGTNLLERVHPNERAAVSDALSAVATERRTAHRIRHANGGYVWVESVVDEDLAPEFGGRVVTARCVDVDRTFPERFREFLEYGTDIVTVVDADGRVRYESPSVEDVLGYEQGSLVGRSPLGYVHPDDRERVTERFYRALADPDELASLEYRYRTADGDWVWLESRTRALPEDAVAGRLVINSRDVTERKRRERRIADRNERLDRFASIVAHDLRNPLSVVKASMEMARVQEDLAPLDRGERAAERIERLTTELLTLARQGKGINEPTEVTLASVAHEAWETAGDDDATLVVADSPRLYADRSRLRQAFENLFRNAIDHACTDDPERAEPSVRIVVTTTANGIVVADDGPGIDPEHRTKVFEPGFTTDEGGTGYGLDIVREIVEAHGWSITVANGGDRDGVGADGDRDGVDGVDAGGFDAADAGAGDDDNAAGSDVGSTPLPRGARFEIRAPTRGEAAATDPWVGT